MYQDRHWTGESGNSGFWQNRGLVGNHEFIKKNRGRFPEKPFPCFFISLIVTCEGLNYSLPLSSFIFS